MSLEKSISYSASTESFGLDNQTVFKDTKRRVLGCFSCLTLPILCGFTNRRVANNASTIIDGDKIFELRMMLTTYLSSDSTRKISPPARLDTTLNSVPLEQTYNGYRPLERIPQEKQSRTRGSSTALHITNACASNTEVGVWWINYQGDPVHYAIIKPGEFYRQHTFEGHVWRLTNGPANGKVFGIWCGAQDETAIVINEHMGILSNISDDWTSAGMDSVMKIGLGHDFKRKKDFSTDNLTILTPLKNEKNSVRYSDGQTTIKFINALNYQVSIYWINWMGKIIHYTNVEPGQKIDQHTYIGHVWRVTMGGPEAEKIGNWVGDVECGIAQIGNTG